VRCWDANDIPSHYHAPAIFEVGLLAPEDWSATWIYAGEESGDAPLFHRAFTVGKAVAQARIYICGLGYYELHLNGCKVGDHLLDPNWTNYDLRELHDMLYPFDDQSTQRTLYITYDITSLLQSGKNALGVIIGNGWHNQHERLIEGRMMYGPPRMILQCEIVYADGATATINSDTSWRTAPSPLTFNNIFFGEVYDARLEQPGWDTPAFSAEGWSPALPAPRPAGTLHAQMSPPDKLMGVLAPATIREVQPGIVVADYGQVFSGWIRLRITGAAGRTVTMRFAEEVFADGTLDFESAGGDEQIQRDIYTCRGDHEEMYEPRFTWHTFRYVEVTGFPGIPTPEALQGCIVHTAIQQTGTFSCSNQLLNTIQDLCCRTQLANYHGGVPSDCPHRERLGYTGDGQLTAEAAMYNFAVAPFYTKWLNDIADAQNHQTGFVPHTAPFYGGGGGPAWGSGYTIVAYQMLAHYGDRRLLETHYAGLAHWLTYLGTRTDARGIITHEEPESWCLGDWSLPGEFALADQVDIPAPLVNTAYYGYCARMMTQLAQSLGKTDDANHYATLAEQITRNFHEAYFDVERGCYAIGRCGTEAFAFLLGTGDLFVEAYTRSLQHLLDYLVARDYHLDTGILGTPALLEALAQNGLANIAYRMLTRITYPSYGYMVENGATTLWENWKKEIGSHCHPMYGGVSAWFFRHLAGIQPSLLHPAYERVTIAPQFVEDLTAVSAAVETPRGKLAVSWERSGTHLDLDVMLPIGCTARIHIPVTPGAVLHEQGQRIGRLDSGVIEETCPGIIAIAHQDHAITIVALGGSYAFEVDEAS